MSVRRFNVYGLELEDTAPDADAYFVRFEDHRAAIERKDATIQELRKAGSWLAAECDRDCSQP